MEITIHSISSHASYALGKITEPVDQFLSSHHEQIRGEIEHFHPHKKAEYVATRILFSELCRNIGVSFGGIHKDEFGKPHLVDSPYHISVSHSFPLIVCMIDQKSPCGVDIEEPREQLIRISKKFLSQPELEATANDIDDLCQLWCAKEALYKIHGRKKLAFAENLFIEEKAQNTFTGEIRLDGIVELYHLKSEQIDGHYLVYNI